ncbi:MAG: hypothetical protein QOJ97_280 [Solirubrobacteraceae bacterium]|nr:hypothetical protein [Solirubrobacteraceae bacterium]
MLAQAAPLLCCETPSASHAENVQLEPCVAVDVESRALCSGYPSYRAMVTCKRVRGDAWPQTSIATSWDIQRALVQFDAQILQGQESRPHDGVANRWLPSQRADGPRGVSQGRLHCPSSDRAGDIPRSPPPGSAIEQRCEAPYPSGRNARKAIRAGIAAPGSSVNVHQLHCPRLEGVERFKVSRAVGRLERRQILHLPVTGKRRSAASSHSGRRERSTQARPRDCHQSHMAPSWRNRPARWGLCDEEHCPMGRRGGGCPLAQVQPVLERSPGLAASTSSRTSRRRGDRQRPCRAGRRSRNP